MKCSKILSPMTGEAVGLGEVPDPVFSQKIVGDGVAVIPSEGKLLSPVDGEIISVADTKHAYGLRTAEGLELLIVRARPCSPLRSFSLIRKTKLWRTNKPPALRVVGIASALCKKPPMI